MSRCTINFRGEEVEVIYHDHGYEYDTNSRTVDWQWADSDKPLELNLTDEEWESIENQIIKISDSRYDD